MLSKEATCKVCASVVECDTQKSKVRPPTTSCHVRIALETAKDSHVEEEKESANRLSKLVLHVSVSPLAHAENKETAKDHNTVLSVALIQDLEEQGVLLRCVARSLNNLSFQDSPPRHAEVEEGKLQYIPKRTIPALFRAQILCLRFEFENFTIDNKDELACNERNGDWVDVHRAHVPR